MNTYKRHRFQLGAPLQTLSVMQFGSTTASAFGYKQSQARGNSHRDIEDLLAVRSITVSREAIRLWCIMFGVIYTRRLLVSEG